jgi:hypothetical protein
MTSQKLHQLCRLSNCRFIALDFELKVREELWVLRIFGLDDFKAWDDVLFTSIDVDLFVEVVLYWSLCLELEDEKDLTSFRHQLIKSLPMAVDLDVVVIHVEAFTGRVLEVFAILFRLVHEEMGGVHLERDISIALNVGRD